jgi:membrane-associated phospholipid phosphatase
VTITPCNSNFARSAAEARWVPVLLALAASLSLVSIDGPAARWSIDESPLKVFKSVLHACEVFGQGAGAGLIALSIAILDPPHRPALPGVFAGSWGVGLVANTAKLFVARWRPRIWIERTSNGNILDTFVDWFPFGRGGSAEQSFPSAHTATAVGLALVLSALYPRGRWYFLTLAALCGLQRVTVHAHFPSDVLAGAAVGWFLGASCAARVHR